MNYQDKYIKYKNKYLQLQKIKLVGGSTNILPKKPKSVATQNQGKNGTCLAHSISRTFVRTFQILGIIKEKYRQKFYDLFYTILLENKTCNEGGYFDDMVYLFNYLDKNINNIFTITKNKTKCVSFICVPGEENIPILKFDTELEIIDFKKDLKFLFDNNLIYLRIYPYSINPDIKNNPTRAIKTMLDYRLQPTVNIMFSQNLITFLDNKETDTYDILPVQVPLPNENREELPVLLPNDKREELPVLLPNDKREELPLSQDNTSLSCVINPNHAVNIRKWDILKIELKNSWGRLKNFAVPDLKYLICENFVNYIEFYCLMFDYNNPNFISFKNKVDINKNSINSPISPELEIIKHNYICDEDNDGFPHGHCILKDYQNNVFFEGNLEHGIKNGKGTSIYLNASYEGNWFNNNKNGIGKEKYLNGSIYEGEFLNNKKYGKGIARYPNNSVYDGDWIDNKKHGKGKIIYPDNSVYDGDWIDNKKYGKGIYIYSDNSVYDGDWIDNKKHGKGIHTFPNSDVYDGDWIDNTKHGIGILKSKDGTIIYEGEWINDEPIK